MTMEVDAKGEQTREAEQGWGPQKKKTGAPKAEIVYDLVQLWVENTALRSRVNELEERMAGLERKLDRQFDRQGRGEGGRPRV